MGDGLDSACQLRVQTPALRDLTDVARMPELTIEEYGGRKCARPATPNVVIDDVLGSDHGWEAYCGT